MKYLTYSFIGLILLALPFLANADPGGGYACHRDEGYGLYGQGGMMGTGGNFMLGFGWIIPFVFWLIIIAVIAFFAVQLLKGQRTHSVSANEASTEILKKRFAKGEINKEEFNQMKKDLKG